MNNKRSSDTSIRFLGLLTLVFIVLKLTNSIAWPWWAVLSPLYLPFVVGTAFLLLMLLLGGRR